MTTGNRDDDRCAYYHRSVQLICGGQRRFHGDRYRDHDFVEPDIAKHGFEPLPSDSGTCRVCGKTPSHGAHSNVPTQPAPETGGEWRLGQHKRDILDSRGFHVAYAANEQHAAQIVADHNNNRSLVEVLTAVKQRAEFALSTPGFIRGRDELQNAVHVADAALAAATGQGKEG